MKTDNPMTDKHLKQTKMNKKTTKKQESEYSKLMKLSPEGHKLSICLGLAGLPCDIKTATLVFNVCKAYAEMGGKFDMATACKIRVNNEEKFSNL